MSWHCHPTSLPINEPSRRFDYRVTAKLLLLGTPWPISFVMTQAKISFNCQLVTVSLVFVLANGAKRREGEKKEEKKGAG